MFLIDRLRGRDGFMRSGVALGAADVTIRPAAAADAAAVHRIAALDSRPVPAGELVVAEVDGEVLAALPIGGGEAIADPFRPTAALLPLLELRALQLRDVVAPAPARAAHPVRAVRALAR